MRKPRAVFTLGTDRANRQHETSCSDDIIFKPGKPKLHKRKLTEQQFSRVKVNETSLSYQDRKKYGLQKKMVSP